MNWRVLKALPPRWRKFVVWSLSLLLAYTVVGFLILPPIVRWVAIKQVGRQFDREVSIRKVKLNPFVLSATVDGLLIKDKDGEPFVSWDEVYVNFQLASFFGHPWVFKQFSVIKPYLRAQMNKDYTFNFSDLVTKFSSNSPAAKPAKPSRPLALRIDEVNIEGAEASLTDLTPREPFKRLVGPLNLNVSDFKTDPTSRNPYSFMGTTDAGEKFAWAGFFSLDPLRSEGDFSIQQVVLNRYAALYQDLVRFQIKDGVADLRSSYQFELSASNRVAAVTNTSFGLHSFKLCQSGGDTNVVEVPELSVKNASLDAPAHQAAVSAVSIWGAKVWVRRDRDNSVNLVELSKPAASATNAPGGILFLLRSITNAVDMLLNSTNLWTASLDNFDIQNCALHLEDMANARPVQLDLDNITLSAQHISNLPGTNLSATLSLRWNTNGTIKTGVEASFNPLRANIDLALKDLDLHPLDPYLEDKLNVFILGSKLGLEGHARMQETNGSSLPEVTFEGNAWLNDFSTVDSVLAQDLLQWRSLRISGMKANLNPPEVSVKEVALDDAKVRVIIETNRTVNLLTALKITNTIPVGTEKEPEHKGHSPPPPPKVAGGSPASVAPGGESLPKLSVASVVLSNAQVHFTDRSLTPAVDWAIEGASGTISGLSSEQMGHADLNLHAKVEGVGPVEITGRINPLSTNGTDEIKVTVQDVDLTPTSPYVGKFAGYRLAEGKLGMKLDYHINGRKLQAQNSIELDRFTFGDKVNSPDATKLPVRLAIAILKDRDGKIQLDVPIEGSLDDPKFRLHKVVVRAIENILIKVATSPFSMLGAVFGGKGEELSFLDFAPGNAALETGSTNKLDSLAKGLYARPALQVEIEGSVDPDADREGLRHAKLERRLQFEKWLSLRKAERAATSAEQVTLTPEEHAHWVKKLYAKALSTGEIKPAPEGTSPGAAPGEAPKPAGVQSREAGAAERESEKGATLLLERKAAPPPAASAPEAGKPKAASEMDPMERALMDNIAITDDDFAALATDRANAAREYLLQHGKVESQRVFIAEKSSGRTKSQGSRANLQLR
jgi:Domain of Unknown Function (DUF748)